MSVFFNGKLLTTPTVATKIDDSAMATQGLTVANNLSIIGKATGGKPKTVYKISSPSEAADEFTSGDLVTAIEKAFSPSSETDAPQYIYAMRVQPATQSRLVVSQEDATAEVGSLQTDDSYDFESQIILDAAATGATDGYYNGYKIVMTSGDAEGETNLITAFDPDTKYCDLRYAWTNAPGAGDSYELTPAALCLESTDYGDHVNRVKIKFQNGTTDGTKYVSTSFDDDEYLVDNLGYTYFTIQYTGDEAEALIDVTATKITVYAGDTDASTELVSCDLTVYDTIGKVVDFFDSQADLEAELGDPSYEDQTPYAVFDYVTGVDILTAETNITANLQAIVDWITGLSEPNMDVYRPTEAGAVPENMVYTYLGGGSTTTATTSDWQDCFDGFQTEDVQCIVPLTSSEAVHAMAVSHCEYMSDNAQMERRCIVGGALDESVDEVIGRAKNLNNDRCYLVAPGYKDYDDDGTLVSYAPYMAAAMLGGMITGSDPGTSLTNKSVECSGFTQNFRNPADTDDLITGGVIAMMETRTGYKVVRSVSTWLANDNYNRVEMGTGYAVDYVARSVRETLETLIGKKGTPAVLGKAVSLTENVLITLAKAAPMGVEVITGDDDNPAYKNITAELNGDILSVSFQCSPVVPVNYIPVTISIVPYSGTATSTASA